MAKRVSNPTGKGGFKKGQSGNPGGRPREVADARDAARQHTPEAIATLAAMLKAANERTRVAAAEALLDRAWGRPPQSNENLNVNIDGDLEGKSRDELLAEARGIAERLGVLTGKRGRKK